MSTFERRPHPLDDNFSVSVPNGIGAALRRLTEGTCDRCHIGPPVRRATRVVHIRGVAEALCPDCQRERRFDRIAAHIHGETR
jgi:imidazolonepropionase-like amidohydrolase